MELKSLLSIVIAVLTALGAMLFAMGTQSPWLATGVWMAAVVSLLFTDFLGKLRLPRNLASFAMWGVMAIYLPYFVVQSDWDNKLRSVANILLCLQIVLLFQAKDSRTYGWLAVMSLLQVVVAARYTQGVAFGAVMILYTVVGTFALSLLALYGPWESHGSARNVSGTFSMPETHGVRSSNSLRPSVRWPLSGAKPSFSSAPVGSGRSGVVFELFARLALIVIGAIFLAVVIFSTVPRPRLSHLDIWRQNRRTVSTVGFNDQIALGGLGDMIENPQEVMQLKLEDPATHTTYHLRENEVYLRGTAVAWYSHGNWRRGKSPGNWPLEFSPLDERTEDPPEFRIGRPIVQHVALEPNLQYYDLFYIWPLVRPLDAKLVLAPTGQLSRPFRFSGEPYRDPFEFNVKTSGLVDGRQAPLVPASEAVEALPYLQMPEGGLPRLTALAARWVKESGMSSPRHYDVARWLEQQLATSGQFHYSLEGQERDTSIDAIEDFVSKHPRGHCEYFATALALMLRSQGIPSRVLLGYRCDEWHEDRQCFQVRELHAHAWVEAYLAPEQIPPGLSGSDSPHWQHGGWLRLDGTPASEVGSQAAARTFWGAWQGRWHALQRSWDNYIVDMDRVKQRQTVYEPISRFSRALFAKLFNPAWWIDLVARLWASLAAWFRGGIMGWLFGAVVVIAITVVPLTVLWLLARSLRWLWRWIVGARSGQRAGVRTSVEFYRRFEQILGRIGIERRAGQTPCEFAHAAGTRLVATTGRQELYLRAMQVAEAFYRVRFGCRTLDAAAQRTVEQALKDLTASEKLPRTTRGKEVM